MNANLGRRLVAEFVGTALLVIFGAGALVAALDMGQGRLDYAGLGVVAISFGLVVAAVVYMFGTTSGAHINPAVTVLAGRGAAVPVGRGRPLCRRTARGGNRGRAAHQRDLWLARERPQRVRRHGRRRGVHEGPSGRRGGAQHIPAPGDDHGARSRPSMQLSGVTGRVSGGDGPDGAQLKRPGVMWDPRGQLGRASRGAGGSRQRLRRGARGPPAAGRPRSPAACRSRAGA